MLMNLFLLLRARSIHKHSADSSEMRMIFLCIRMQKTKWLFRGELFELNGIVNVGRYENVRKMK